MIGGMSFFRWRWFFVGLLFGLGLSEEIAVLGSARWTITVVCLMMLVDFALLRSKQKSQ